VGRNEVLNEKFGAAFDDGADPVIFIVWTAGSLFRS
jgi:hypothetical protein